TGLMLRQNGPKPRSSAPKPRSSAPKPRSSAPKPRSSAPKGPRPKSPVSRPGSPNWNPPVVERMALLCDPHDQAIQQGTDMRKHLSITFVVLCCLSTTAAAADLKLLPAKVVLTGPHATQQLLALCDNAGTIDADLTAQARFASSNPAVATVDAAGVVR